MKKEIYYIIGFLFVLQACSVQKFLPEGERLVRGSKISIEKSPEVEEKNKNIKSLLKTAVSPKPNTYFLGQPWKVWWWYTIGEPENPKGFKAFLREKLGEPPVLSHRLKPEAIAENMQSLMENNGYFQTTVQGDTLQKKYFVYGNYHAQVKPQYEIREVNWVKDSSAIKKALMNTRGRPLIRPGKPYNLNDIKAERERLDLRLKNRGYYYFNPDYLMAYVDSTVGDRKVDIHLNIKKEVPKDALQAFRINRITIYTNYSLAQADMDTSSVGLVAYKGLYIKDSLQKYKPKLFASSLTYTPGKLYNSRQQNASLNRLIGLGTFKFVKNRFEKDLSHPDSNLLNVYYYLTPAPKKSLQGQIDGFTKDNNYLGSQLSVNWKNRNAFRGAEHLSVKAFGGIETSYGDSVKSTRNYRLGANVSLRVPRYIIPFFKIKENHFYQPNTNFSLGYEWYRKELFYTKNAFTGSYEFTWKKNNRTQFTVAPVSLSYIRATNVTEAFFEEVQNNPSLLLNIFDEAIVGSYANFVYATRPRNRNRFLYSIGLDLSGNILGALTGAKNFRESTIFGTPFAQYVKLDVGAHYTRRLRNRFEWANRLELGIGMPYNNSRLLPFAKQYSIGGANSIRGFSTRSMGPGTYKPSAEDQRFFQLIGGDYRLLANTELRIPFSNMFSGAVFVDAGNIWTKDTLLFGRAGKLSEDWFKEIAVATGIGLRIDLNFLLVRFDVGMPLRKPFFPDGERWVMDEIDFGSKDWRRENLILNIAIGLPF